MGQPLERVCKDCKEIHYIGYGSSNLKESDRYKAFSESHGNHDIIDICDDYCSIRGNDLVFDHPYLSESEQTVIIENYTDYERIGFD